MKPGSIVIRLIAGFLGGLAATLVLGLVVLGLLGTFWPGWHVAWTMGGTKERALWIGVPSIALYGTMTLLLWRARHRAVATGVVLFALTDVFITLLV